MRRRKPRVVWLPTTNTFSVDDNASSTWSLANVAITGADAQTGGSGGQIEVPIVMDGIQSDPLGATSSLADIESSGYRLRRIVGKVYCFMAQSVDFPTIAEDIWGVTAGFMVRRVNPQTGGSLAAAAAGPPFVEIDPAAIDNSMDPWIWRRSWLLSNYTADSVGTAVPGTRAQQSLYAHAGGGTNYGRAYPGGNSEGPHVDQKTARIVGPEERLFLDVSATPILTSSVDTSLVIIYDVRVLASMRTNSGNRRNASR